MPTDLSEAASPDAGNSIYELIREDILEGRLSPNERLKVSDLARRHGTSTNPVREALQQLRGEGFVIFSPNRGARVRSIDEDFVRDIFEVEILIEPFLTRWFVGIATEDMIADLEAVQRQIEELNFRDETQHSALDTRFHRSMYERHYNRHAVDLWWKHRQILAAISRSFPFSLSRRTAILSEHRELLDAFRRQDAGRAGEVIAAHVEGSGRHIIEQLRARR